MNNFFPLQILFPRIKLEAKDSFNSSTMWSLVQELSVVQRGYQQIISSLPRGEFTSWNLTDELSAMHIN
jgi:hypothetical protein